MTQPFNLDFNRLDRLLLNSKGGLAGNSSGKRLTNKYGSSLEFADYREYLPGDDIRRVDWSLYGRSRRLYTRLNRSEMDATVHIVVDGSASMGWGENAKGYNSLGLALALGYISIRAYDRVALAVGCKELGTYLPPVHGKTALPRVIRFLTNQEFGAQGDLNLLLSSLGRVLRPRQLTVVISDFLSPWQDGLEKLLMANQQVLVFVVTSPDEEQPNWRGPVTLVDSETGAKKDVDLDHWTLTGYQQAIAHHRQEIMSFCHSRGISSHVYNTGQNPVDFLWKIAPSILKKV